MPSLKNWKTGGILLCQFLSLLSYTLGIKATPLSSLLRCAECRLAASRYSGTELTGEPEFLEPFRSVMPGDTDVQGNQM